MLALAAVARRPLAARGLSALAAVTDAHIEGLRALLADRPGAVVTDADALEPFNTDFMGQWRGSAPVALRPRSTAEVSAVLRYCNEHRLPVVPQGGNTGLVGGSVPAGDEVVLSLQSMNQVLAFDEVSGILTCEAGCVLEQLQRWLAERDHVMPVDLGAKGSCQIGGNVATNAGGLRYLRHGSLHGTVLGLEVVRADGQVLDLLSAMRKDNTGYDLKQLFIGAEGTLGVITKVAIQTPRASPFVNVAMLACPSFDAVLEAFVLAKQRLGEILSAVEYVDRACVERVLEVTPGARDPFDDAHPFYLLIETSGSHAEHDAEKLEAFVEAAMEAAAVEDGTWAQGGTQAEELWTLRETVSTAINEQAHVYKYDVSLPLSQFEPVVEEMRARLEPAGARVYAFGHLGDANLHFNATTPEFDPAVKGLIEPHFFDRITDVRGSISAEHGLGQAKNKYLPRVKDAASLEAMRALKAVFDPNGIMNPGKLLPAEG